MPVPRIAIVGRPNAGKSSLLNMLAGQKVSIVDPVPGITRDRVSVLVELEAPYNDGPRKTVELLDTGGFGVYTAEGRQIDDAGHDLAGLTGEIESQIAEAVSSADLILFCIDCQAGITPADLEIAKLLREQRLGSRRRDEDEQARVKRDKAGLVPVRIIATKCDGQQWEPHAYELAALGFDEPIACSAKNNYFRRELIDTLWELMPETSLEDMEPEADLKIALIGKRNAGKSTLINTLAGEPRVIVSEIPGTTRDAVDVRFQFGDKSVLAIDTAGLRRKKSMDERVEWFAFDRAQRAIERADVILMLIDGTERISQVDEQLAMLVQKAMKPCVVVVNKWDMIEGQRNAKGKKVSPEDFEEYLRKELKGLSYAPIAMMSGKSGLNVREVIDLAFDLQEQANTRVGTGELNRIITEIVDAHGPASKLGTFAKVYYVTQAEVNPPTIVMVVNRPKLFTPNYERYMLNRLREALPYAEVPIRIVVRGRSQRKGDEDVAVEALPAADELNLLPAEDYFDDD
ncbi:MAG: ribosome biogenesis GTPase Der [Phycisphaeraceae bacterium]|nr:ribosome biogenesis GTPase Der [Phycisphaerales bacterium]MCB9860451.1 ribosome biogenesis GTPase Der [Phycisphaeraceae bacterium]